MVRHTIELSKKPLLVAGHGIRLANAQDELMKVLDKGIPVVTTFNGFDLVPSDHSSFVGRIGTLGTEGGNYALRNCSLLICVGTRNNIRQISFEWKNFAPQATKIIVDIDKEELYKPTIKGAVVPYQIDAKKFLKKILTYKINIDKDWFNHLRQYDKEHDVDLTPPYKFMRELTEELPNDAVVVCGNGAACDVMFQAGIVKKGQRIFWNSGTASMGYDLPAAIGACMACKRKVICITGDGSIMMNIQELQTIKHYKLPIKIFLLNNKGYRSLELTQTNYFKKDFIGCNKRSGISFPHFGELAELYGLRYFGDYNLKHRIKEILDYKGATLCEVEIGNRYKIQKRTL